MTRFKLIPWLVIPALLLAAAVVSMAQAEEDGLMYLPLDDALTTQSAEEPSESSDDAGLKIAQFGVADAAVANRNKWLAVRFDAPIAPPYNVVKVHFPSRTANQDPAQPASFRSIRLIAMSNATGLPNKAQTLYRVNRYLGSSNGGNNIITFNPPITINDPNVTLFWVYDFPAPLAGVADTFPFLLTDRQFTDKGLYANSYAMDTTATVSVAPPALGTITGTAVLADQNIVTTMFFEGATTPTEGPKRLGFNGRVGQARWYFTGDGSPVELVVRNPVWTPVASVASGDEVVLPAVPGSGSQIWGVRSLNIDGTTSLVSNVTITGSTGVVGYAAQAEDAAEPNGDFSEATAVVSQGSIWPAGEQDNYSVSANPGDIIQVDVTPNPVDNRNDAELVVSILSSSGAVLASSTGAPGSPVHVDHVVPDSDAGPANFVVKIIDRNSVKTPSTPRVLVASTYDLSVSVTPAPAFAIDHPSIGANSLPGSESDNFAFANAGANPVRGQAMFSYVIPRGQNNVPVNLRIYDVRGRLMSTLVSGAKPAGTHYAMWHGRVAPGAYFARIQAGSFTRTVRVDVLN